MEPVPYLHLEHCHPIRLEPISLVRREDKIDPAAMAEQRAIDALNDLTLFAADAISEASARAFYCMGKRLEYLAQHVTDVAQHRQDAITHDAFNRR